MFSAEDEVGRCVVVHAIFNAEDGNSSLSSTKLNESGVRCELCRVSDVDAVRVQTPTWEAKGVKPTDAFSLTEEESADTPGDGPDRESSPGMHNCAGALPCPIFTSLSKS